VKKSFLGKVGQRDETNTYLVSRYRMLKFFLALVALLIFLNYQTGYFKKGDQILPLGR